MNLQVADFERWTCVSPCPITEVGSRVCYTLSWACIFLRGSAQRTVAEYLYLKPRMTGSKHKNSSDVAVTAKKHHRVMVKTKSENNRESEARHVKSIRKLLQYTTVLSTVLVWYLGLTLYLLNSGLRNKLDLMDMFSERNLFVCRELTV